MNYGRKKTSNAKPRGKLTNDDRGDFQSYRAEVYAIAADMGITVPSAMVSTGYKGRVGPQAVCAAAAVKAVSGAPRSAPKRTARRRRY